MCFTPTNQCLGIQINILMKLYIYVHLEYIFIKMFSAKPLTYTYLANLTGNKTRLWKILNTDRP